MRNVFAIGLVLTSLFAAAVWSPSPTQHDQDHREVIVKEGHRVVVVEYDKEADGSTKVLISPHDVVAPSEADSKDVSNDDKPTPEAKFSSPKELVCDAYGKCKHNIATALGKTRDKVEEIETHAISAANEAKDKLSEQVTEKVTGKAKESVVHGIDKAKRVANDALGIVKDGVVKVKNFDVVDSPKRIGEDIEGNMTGKVEESAKETVENVTRMGEKSLDEILRKLKDVTHDVIWYLVSRDKIDAVAGLVHMLGFSTAYGMCVWVTLISSYILGRHLPKQQFGVVQSRIYPVYFKAMAYCVSAALFGYLASKKYGILRSMIRFQCLSLFSALLMVLTNMILLEPRATMMMYERMKIEKEEGRGVAVPTRDGVVHHTDATHVVRSHVNVVEERQDVLKLNEKLKRLNSYSSALNVSTLVALTWHMAYIGTQVHASRMDLGVDDDDDEGEEQVRMRLKRSVDLGKKENFVEEMAVEVDGGKAKSHEMLRL
ncbi:hypothetical protein L1987_66376 [Smallanthus sonchifolius]|uniref:Uncharacterized protein n=1 Tax=Smallanthus sonchifolius TaxID=185202 RepID=A0ACB9BX95_9ASTR|nr:hypothetical protein L1987_66376 [Smallanthus sonchifolius]